jgi:hypothetical protein
MYVPNNRIKINKYTQGEEFVVKSTNKNYIGFYHTLYNGKIFSGKTPNSEVIGELIDINKITDSLWESEAEGKSVQRFVSHYDGEVFNDQFQNEKTIRDYNRVISNDMSKVKTMPTSHYPKVTDEDYKLGSFTRYFCVKINESQFIEISKDTHDKLNNKDGSYPWEMYTSFKLEWTIKGEIRKVIKTNKDIITLTESKLKRRGLDAFLRQNYKKFWQL